VGEKTGIAWTDSTFNPWHGCQRVSPGCENCYAEALDHRKLCQDTGVVFFGKQHANAQGMKLKLLFDGYEDKNFPVPR